MRWLLLLFCIYSQVLCSQSFIKFECDEDGTYICGIKKDSTFSKDVTLKAVDAGIITDKRFLACCYHRLGIHYYTKNSYYESILSYEKAIKIREEYEDGELWRSYKNLGYAYVEAEYYENGIKYILKAFENNKAEAGGAWAHINLGDSYCKLGEFEKAISTIKIAEELAVDDNETLGDAYNVRCKCLTTTNEGENLIQAINYGNKALELFKREGIKRKIAMVYNNLGNAYQGLIQYSNAIKSYEEAIKNRPKTEVLRNARTLNNIATALYGQGKNKEAIKRLIESLEIKENKYENLPTHYDYAANYENLAENYEAIGEIDTALTNYQLALINLTNNFRNQDINTNPKTTDSLYIYNKPDLLRVLDLKAQAALKNKNIDLAHNTYQTLDNWINEFYQDLSTNQSKLTWIARAHAMYSRAIEVALEKDDKEQAFEYAEKARAVLLWQSHSQQAALSLLDKDKREKYDNLLAQIRQADYEYRNAETTQEKSASKTKLDESKSEFDQFEMSLGDDYFQRKYQPKTITAQEVQESILNDSTALVEYHWSADDMLYIFTLTKNDIYADSVRLDSSFHNQIQKYNTAMQGSEGLGKSGYPIYQTAFEPIRKHLKNIKKIILLPDGKLNQIPFDALPTKPTSKPPYLIEEYTFNHLYSCSSYPNTSAVDTLRTALYIAPKFDGTNKLSELAPTEITKKLKALNLSTTTLTVTEPTRQRVIDEMADTDILHFHTHAEQGKKGTGKIHLYGGEELSQNDIQASTLKARHVVLSACETGIGELRKGEGVLSLGWSFVYRGVPSVVTSLWKVDASSTSDLMENYYEYLNKGMSGDEALRQAKLNMLNKHPYHWSAFAHTGNPPTQKHDSNPYKYFLIIGGFLLILLLIYVMRKTKTTPKRNIPHPKTV